MRALRISSLSLCLLVLMAASPSRRPEDQSHRPSDEEAHDLLPAICPDNIGTDQLGAVAYAACKSCPAFTTRAQLGMGQNEHFGLETVIYGSFTAPGVREAVTGFAGCEDHASTANFRSSVLLGKDSSGWRMIRYERFETTKCRTYRLATGRDILLCQGWTGHADQSSAWVFTYDFLGYEDDLFSVVNTWGACRSTAIVGAIDNVELRDLDRDGMPDLSIYAKVTKEAASGELGVCAGDFSPPPAKTYRVDFLFKESKFIVAPWSVETANFLNDLFNAYK